MSDFPADPFVGLRASAIQMHELFTCWLEAGFSEEQAMRLLVTMLTESLRGPKRECDE